MNELKLILTTTSLFLNILLSHSQIYMVYKDDHTYVCLSEQDGQEILKDKSAAKVIQFAIDECSKKGGTGVLLGKGIFPLEIPVRLKENIWLHGKNRGTELKVIDPDNNGLEIIQADNVKISDLTIISADNFNSMSGIYGIQSKSCIISDVHIYGFVDSGISFYNDFSEFKIDRCTFIDNEQVHIYLEGIGKDKPDNTYISNCTFYCGGYGIKAEKGRSGSCGLKITDNVFAQIKGMAIDSDFDSVIITGNKLYWIGLDGMKIGGEGFLVSGNINSWIRGHGLVMEGARAGTVSGNNFTDCGVRSRDGLRKCGIYLSESTENSILGNSIWNFGDQGYLEYAVYEESDCSNNLIKGNTGWFHANPEAFHLRGLNTIADYNTSNKGEYRYDDYWDYTQKYGYAAHKFLEDLYSKKENASIMERKYTPFNDHTSSTLKTREPIIIESRDMFEQLISIKDNSPKKFGWTGDDSQIWELGDVGDHYIIKNIRTNQLLECSGMDENSLVSLGNKEETIKDSRLWKIIDVGSGYFIIKNKLSCKVLESQGLSNYSWNENNVFYRGQIITVSVYKGRKTQMWRFRDPFPAYVYGN